MSGLRVGGSGVRVAAAIVSALALATISAAPAGATPTWTVVSDASKPPAVELTGVDCVSTSHCFATGYRQTGNDYFPVIEQGNGRVWSTATIKSPPSARPNDFPPLSAVECVAPKTCFAVGTYYDPSNEPTALIQHWNGSGWEIMKAAAPVIVKGPPKKLSAQTSLNSVTCPSAKNCFAVGYYAALNGTISALVEHWTGTTWAAQTAPTAGALPTVLHGVSCVTATNCFAVGTSIASTHTKPFVIRWDGTAWSTMTSPALQSAGLDDIACAGATACFALGSVTTNTTSTLVERWNGTKWSVVKLTNMPTANRLFGIACPSATTCFAVGRRIWTQAGTRTMVLQWNGTTWAALDPPNQPGAVSNSLNAVSCWSATVCKAVGSFVSDDTTYHTLIERYA